MLLKKRNPFLTIIIPTYNSEVTLAVALGSIVNQTFKDVEILIMDGLSIDSTLEVVKGFQVQYSNIHIHSDSDKGIYDAMNKGIALAKGEWLYFMGSDDTLFDLGVLKNIFQELENNAIDVLYGNVNSAFYGGKYDGEFTYEKLTRLNICHQAIFFHKSVFKIIGNFNLKYKVEADWDHNIKWFFSDKINYKYIDLMIAEFADGGYSYTHNDLHFAYKKNHKFLISGFNKLPLKVLKNMCKSEILKYKDSAEYFKLFFLKGYMLVLKTKFKWYKMYKKNELF